MSDRGPGVAAAIGFGVCFVLAGAALLLQELDLLALRWTYVLPAVVVAVGLGILVSGIARAHGSRNATVTGVHGPVAGS